MYYVNCVIQDVDYVAITDFRWPFKTPCLTYGLRYMYDYGRGSQMPISCRLRAHLYQASASTL